MGASERVERSTRDNIRNRLDVMAFLCCAFSLLAAAAGHHNRADCSRPRVAAAGVAACGGARKSSRINSWPLFEI